jgi:tetratricopeptide (TPR) repeat protein
MFVWVMMILGGVWFIQQVTTGEIKPLFQATPTPTRAVESLLMEGEANFTAGNLDNAISAYREAVRLNPNDADTWAKLARIETYSSAFLITDAQKKERLLQALESARKAVEIAPESSNAHAILSFTLDWNANPSIYKDDRNQVDKFLAEAEQAALTALLKDNTNTLALAYYAEILLDQQKWNEAQQNINQALAREDADQIMDVHRVNAAVLETLGQYNLAISEYDKAIAIEPNFTFLYIRAGANYRRLAIEISDPKAALPVYEKSLEYFDKATKINEQIGVQDPGPYLSISRTYSQLGEFFAAARNVQKALEFDPTNADIYGQLGIVYFRSRNYEGSIYTLKCAIRGCSGEDSCLGKGLDECAPELGPRFSAYEITGLPISPATIVYYYTYGSVLSALSRRADNKCGEAYQIFSEVKTELNANPDAYADGYQTIISIVQAGEAICDSFGDDAVTTPSAGGEAGTSTPEAGLSDMTATPSP